MLARKPAVAVLGLCLFHFVSPTHADIAISPIAISGDPAPDTPPGTTYSSIYYVNLNDAGLLAVGGKAKEAKSTSTSSALWSGPISNLKLLAMAHQHAAGAPVGVSYGDFYIGQKTPISFDGHVVFGGILEGPGVTQQNQDAMWAGTPGSIQLIARREDPTRDIPGTTYYNVWPNGSISANGQLIYHADYKGETPAPFYGSATWMGSFESPSLILDEGRQAPGLPPGITLTGSFFTNANGKGQVAVNSWLKGPGYEQSSGSGHPDYGIWIGTPDNLQLVYRTKTQAPGLPDGVQWVGGAIVGPVTFGFGLGYEIDERGKTAFVSFLNGPGVDDSNREAIWYGGPGSVRLVARSGSQAPGLAPGVNFGTVLEYQPHSVLPYSFNYLQHNLAGQIAFQSKLSGPAVTSANDESLWGGDPDNIRLIARKGDHAPGTPEGVVFNRAGHGSSVYMPFEIFVLGGSGQVAFVAGLSGPGVDLTNLFGLWATDQEGQPVLIARSGDFLDIGHGERRQIDFFQPQSFNSLGQLTFIAEFTDGTNGAFVATVPEPSTLAPILASLFILRRTRRAVSLL